jgi:hypothetical protein
LLKPLRFFPLSAADLLLEIRNDFKPLAFVATYATTENILSCDFGQLRPPTRKPAKRQGKQVVNETAHLAPSGAGGRQGRAHRRETPLYIAIAMPSRAKPDANLRKSLKSLRKKLCKDL